MWKKYLPYASWHNRFSAVLKCTTWSCASPKFILLIRFCFPREVCFPKKLVTFDSDMWHVLLHGKYVWVGRFSKKHWTCIVLFSNACIILLQGLSLNIVHPNYTVYNVHDFFDCLNVVVCVELSKSQMIEHVMWIN